jgi:hypothetical protein
MPPRPPLVRPGPARPSPFHRHTSACPHLHTPSPATAAALRPSCFCPVPTPPPPTPFAPWRDQPQGAWAWRDQPPLHTSAPAVFSLRHTARCTRHPSPPKTLHPRLGPAASDCVPASQPPAMACPAEAAMWPLPWKSLSFVEAAMACPHLHAPAPCAAREGAAAAHATGHGHPVRAGPRNPTGPRWGGPPGGCITPST